MTFIATDDRATRQAQQFAQMGPLTQPIGGTAPLEGLGTATALGIGRGFSSLAALSNEAEEFTPFGTAKRTLDDLFDLGIEEREREAITSAIASTQLDPETTGWAGSLSYGITGTLVPGIIGTAVGGPIAGAALAGGSVGAGTYADLQAEGVDADTAAGAAWIEGGITALSFGLPAGLGLRTLTRAGTGAAINVAAGGAERAAMGSYLDARGYGEMAERYKVLDGMAIANDAILGAAFGALPAGRLRPSTAETDAALTSSAAVHAERDLAPGLPTNAAAAAANIRAQDEAIGQMLAGEPVTANAEGHAFTPKPADPQFSNSALVQAFRDSGLPGILDEIAGLEAELTRRGRDIPDEPLPELPTGQERRADRNEVERLQQLRTERGVRRLTIDEADELLTLEDRDRKAAKVAGRRIPGVQNMEARNEAEASGRLLPVQGFADADNFKAINDSLGHEIGDQVIGRIGMLFAQELGEGNVFHRGGDEFIMQARSADELDAAMQRVRDRLDAIELVATMEDGTTAVRRGVRFSYGHGQTVREAEHAQYADKAARKAAGLRSDRQDARPTADDRRAGTGVDRAGEEDRSGGTEGAAGAQDPAAVMVERDAKIAAEGNPDLAIPTAALGEAAPDGLSMTEASVALKAADESIAQAESDAPAFDAAVSCFLRNGA